MRLCCPVCEPDEDLRTVEIDYCAYHAASLRGVDDDRVQLDACAGGIEEAGGEGNRLLCDFLHRGVL